MAAQAVRAAAWARESVLRHPSLVPLLFAAANLRHAKLRAHNVAVCVLLAAAAELCSDLGGAAWAWGAVAPPAVAAFIIVPLYLLLMRVCGGASAGCPPPSAAPSGWCPQRR